MATFSELKTRVYKLINEKTDSTVFTDSYVWSVINEIQHNICVWDVTNLETWQVYQSPYLRFLASKSFFKSVDPINLTAAVATTDTEISFTTTNFLSSGDIYINGDIITYTWKTATQITGVTWIATTHDSWEEVKQAFQLPTDAWKGFSLRLIEDNQETPIPYMDDRALKDQYLYYTIVSDSTSTDEFIVIEWYTQNDKTLVLDYYKTSTDMSASGDSTDLPDPYGMQVLAPLVAWEILYNSDERQNGVGFLREGYSKLQQMYTNYSARTKEYRRKVKTRAFDRHTIGWNYPPTSLFRNNNKY